MTTTTAADWIEQFQSAYRSYQQMTLRHRLPVSDICERRAHAALRAAVAAEPIRAFRVCGARRTKACPWQYWDYVLIDIVPAKSRPGAAVRLASAGAERRFRSAEKALRLGREHYPDRISLGIGAWQRLADYDGVLFFLNWLTKQAPDYCQRHPELATIASDLSAALALAELV
jgi:hypothetical protein